MLLHFILLLPTIHTSNIVINHYSVKQVKQVKLDDDMMNKVLVKIFPKNEVQLKMVNDSLGNETDIDTSDEDGLNFGGGMMVPTYEQAGQKRFKKISNRVDPEKYSVRDNNNNNMEKKDRTSDAGDDEDNSDPMLLLSNLVVKLMEYLPPKLKLK